MIDNRPTAAAATSICANPSECCRHGSTPPATTPALAGKWIHNYEPLTPPPGWDRWWGLVPATATAYYDYSIADSDGGLDSYGSDDSDYQTDVLTREYALPFIAAHAADPDPFFLHLSYTAPHWGSGRRRPGGQALREPEAVLVRHRARQARSPPRRALSHPRAAAAALLRRA